jgi:hypothetical protein
MLSNASPIHRNISVSCAFGSKIILSKGWKLGMIPTKFGRGSMGKSDFGLWLMGLGKSISGGGIICFETKRSKDYSPSIWTTISYNFSILFPSI